MSEKQNAKPGFFARAAAWCKALPGRITAAFKNMVAELKKVAWPSREDLINYSLVVIVFVVALSIVVGVLDTASSALVRLLVQL
ncbi:MAG: preprotein translocase subunit SecE [Clostridiales bacterium]|nr:preprotein translocase subunit SecE [Clostridiales bacterium]